MKPQRSRPALTFALLSALLLTLALGGASYLLVDYGAAAREGQLVAQDRELARFLAGLRTPEGDFDFAPVALLIEGADLTALGLVYALERDAGQALRNSALNPRAFAALDPHYREAMRAGRLQVLARLAARQIDRRGRLKEYRLPLPHGTLQLGFDVQRLERQLATQRTAAWAVIGAALLIGVLVAFGLAQHRLRPLRQLAAAFDGASSGELPELGRLAQHDALGPLARSFARMLHTLRQLRRLEAAHACYLPGPVRERVLRAGSARELPVEERAATVLCCTLRPLVPPPAGKPRERLALLNDYLAPLLDALLAEGAVVLTLTGHQLQAVWGAPDDDAQREAHALRGALAARAAVADQARRQALSGQPVLALASGLCSGRVAAGNLGSAERATYALVGDAVDHAAAIAARAEPGEILLGEPTYRALSAEALVQAAAPLLDTGRAEALPLYRLEGLRATAPRGEDDKALARRALAST